MADWLLGQQLMQRVKLKLNPLVLGDDVRLFESSTRTYQLELLDSTAYEKGLQIMDFRVLYG